MAAARFISLGLMILGAVLALALPNSFGTAVGVAAADGNNATEALVAASAATASAWAPKLSGEPRQAITLTLTLYPQL